MVIWRVQAETTVDFRAMFRDTPGPQPVTSGYRSVGLGDGDPARTSSSTRPEDPHDPLLAIRAPDRAVRILRHGGGLQMYPEGRRGPGTEVLPFDSGVARLALGFGAARG